MSLPKDSIVATFYNAKHFIIQIETLLKRFTFFAHKAAETVE